MGARKRKPSKSTATLGHPTSRHEHSLEVGEEPSQSLQVTPATPKPRQAKPPPIEVKPARGTRWRVAPSVRNAIIVAAAFIGLYFYFYAGRNLGQHDVTQASVTGRQSAARETRVPSQELRKSDLSRLPQHAEPDQARALTSAQISPALEASAFEMRQSLERKQRLEVVENELAVARRAIEARDLQIDVRDRQLQELEGELAMVRRETEASVALITELQQERNRADTLELALTRASAQPKTGAPIAPERAAKNQTHQVPQAVAVAALEQPDSAGSPGDREMARLIGRASVLLGQGNISGARIVLERAAEAGSAFASFKLAQTYDPVILATWGTYGTRGDAAKARELYAKAHAGGVQDAQDRFIALNK